MFHLFLPVNSVPGNKQRRKLKVSFHRIRGSLYCFSNSDASCALFAVAAFAHVFVATLEVRRILNRRPFSQSAAPKHHALAGNARESRAVECRTAGRCRKRRSGWNVSDAFFTMLMDYAKKWSVLTRKTDVAYILGQWTSGSKEIVCCMLLRSLVVGIVL